MPTYDYKCEGEKQHVFEKVLTFKESDTPQTCPKCQAPAKRVIRKSSPVVYRGNDWPGKEGREF